MGNFEKISEERAKEIEDYFLGKIINDYQKQKGEDGFHVYEVQLQDICFRTEMSDEELKLAIHIAIEIMEELKVINNSGMNREKLSQIVKRVKDNKASIFSRKGMVALVVMQEIETDRLFKLINKLCSVCCVGGAHAMLISLPQIRNVIYMIYDRNVDCFDEEIYIKSTYFLSRAIMRMNSETLN